MLNKRRMNEFFSFQSKSAKWNIKVKLFPCVVTKVVELLCDSDSEAMLCYITLQQFNNPGLGAVWEQVRLTRMSL